MDSDKDIGRRLIAFREDLPMNQVQFAKALHIAKSTLNGYETGERPLTAERAKQIRKRFGVSLDWLLSGDVSQPGQAMAVKLGPNPAIKADAKTDAVAQPQEKPKKRANK